MGEMTRLEKVANLGAVVVPFVATIARDHPAPHQLGQPRPTWRSPRSCTCSPRSGSRSASTACSPTVPSRPPSRLEYTFAVLGSMAVQGPVISWVADHRKHHAHTDKEGDPHSPHVGHGGLRGVFAGLWHAHTGWLMATQGRADWKKYARDLYEDRGMRFISRHFVAAGLAQPGDPGAGRVPGHRHAGRRAAPACSGAAWSGSSSSTTSPGASTRSATSSASAASRPTISPPTSSGSPSPHWASPGTTTTTLSRARPCTA